jgi:hypothetical protein
VFSIELLLLLGGLPESDEVVVLSFFVLSHFENDGVQLPPLLGGLPESDEVVVLSFFVLSRFENDGVQLLPHPADRPVLFEPIRTLVKVVWVRKNFLRLFESDASFRVCS